jgi:hypothetical protein
MAPIEQANDYYSPQYYVLHVEDLAVEVAAAAAVVVVVPSWAWVRVVAIVADPADRKEVQRQFSSRLHARGSGSRNRRQVFRLRNPLIYRYQCQLSF